MSASRSWETSSTADAAYPQWIECPVCHKPTASTSMFCINGLAELVAFTPKWWITTIIMLAPLFVTLLLSAWPSELLFYSVLSIGVALYLWTVFRQFGRHRTSVIIWTVLSFLLVGFQERASSHVTLANLITISYFLMFGTVIFQRAYSYLREDEGAMSVAISCASAVASFYSLLMELAVLLHRLGLSAVEWLDRLYVEWFFWIWSIRAMLVCVALTTLAVKAADELVSRPARRKSTAPKLIDHLFAQLFQWADTTFTWVQILRQLFVQTASVCVRMTVHFATNDVVPVLLILCAAYLTFSFSRGLTLYILFNAFPPLLMAIFGATSILLVFGFEYFQLVSATDTPSLKWPPLRQIADPFWKGAITDTASLVFGLSYIVPATTGLLAFAHIVGAHFHRDVGFVRFGLYFAIFLLAFVGMLVWGFARRERDFAR